MGCTLHHFCKNKHLVVEMDKYICDAGVDLTACGLSSVQVLVAVIDFCFEVQSIDRHKNNEGDLFMIVKFLDFKAHVSFLLETGPSLEWKWKINFHSIFYLL